MRESRRSRREVSNAILILRVCPDISHSLDEIAKKIVANGGKIVDLDEPKLTHIVLDKRDISRRTELVSRTSKSVLFLHPVVLRLISVQTEAASFGSFRFHLCLS